MDVSQLTEQKQKYLFLIESAYSEINQIYHDLNAKFEQLYLNYNRDDSYEIATVDFWFGEIACNYRGKNYELSDMLFELNNELRGIEAFDLNESQVIEIYNMLTLLCKEVYGGEFESVENADLSINEILDKFKILTDQVVKICKNNQYMVHKVLGISIEKLYVLIDFALYEDSYYDMEAKHNDLRNLREEFLSVQSTLYDSIAIYQEKIDLIDEQLEEIEKVQTIEKLEEAKQNLIKQQELQESIIQTQESTKRGSIKEKLVDSLGGIGVILYLLIRVIIYVLPFVMIDGGFFLTFLLIIVNSLVPFATIVFWIWGLVCAIKGVQDVWAIVYYMAFVVIWLPFFISTIVSFFQNRRNF